MDNKKEIITEHNNIGEIARKHGITLKCLIAANGREIFRTGEIINVPIPYDEITVDKDMKEIAKEYGTTIKELLRINEKAKAEIQIGDKLYVPKKSEGK